MRLGRIRTVAITLMLASMVGCDRENFEYVTVPPLYDSKSVALTGTVESYAMEVSETFRMSREAQSYYFATDDAMDIPAHESTIDLYMKILPIYCFGATGASGDYYAVSGYVLAHNDKMYETRSRTYFDDLDKWLHEQEICANFMRDLSVRATILDSEGQELRNAVRFEQYPKPETTVGETSYTSGWSVDIGIAVQIGGNDVRDDDDPPEWWQFLTGVLLPKFNYNSSDSQSRTLPDQSVEQTSSTDGSAVEFHFLTNNYEKAHDSEIPNVSKHDQICYFSWVWFLPSGTNDVQDYSEDRFSLKLDIGAKAGTNESDKGLRDDYHSRLAETCSESVNVPLPQISRIPSGEVTLMNLASLYVKDLRVTLSQYGEAPLCYGDDNVYGKNQTASMTLREGYYDIWFDMVDGDTSEVKRHCVIQNVFVKADGTTACTTLDAKTVDDDGRVRK